MNTTAEAKTKQPTLDDGFIKMLEELHAKADRAALAALRRGLGKRMGEAMEAYRFIAPFAANSTSRQQEESFYLVATLFGLHPSENRPGESWFKTNLGASLRDLKDDIDSKGAERRLVALLNSHRDELADHLRHIVSLLKSKGISVNWRRLLNDIRWWDNDERDVQRKWAKAFWGNEQSEKTTE